MGPSDETRTIAALEGSGDLIASGHRVADPPVGSPDPAVRQILQNAVRVVPGADHAGITLCHDGAILTWGPSRPGVEELDLVQDERGEGPCVAALRARRTTTVLVDDVEDEAARWPSYAAAAARLGIRSVLAFVMAPPGAAPGAVTLYAGRPSAFTRLSQTIASAFAIQTGVALFGCAQIGRLIEALETREVVGQATGILMERFGLDDRQAFAMLSSSAQDTEQPLRDIATWLTTQGKHPRAG